MVDSAHLFRSSGLTEEEAKALLTQEGFNELPQRKERRFLGTLLKVLGEPMLLLLIACGVLYLMVGDRLEAVVLFSFVLFVLLNTLYQERKTEHALAALKKLSNPRAKVVRDGKKQYIDSRLVVPGDLLCLSEGDRIPADAILCSATHLLVDESLLTGESLPVRKTAETTEVSQEAPGGDDLPFVYSGSLVIRGEGMAKVQKTGIHTQVGNIGKQLASVHREKTPLQKESYRLVRMFAGLGIVLCIAIFLAHGFLYHAWLKGLLASLALAMAMIPEEIPMIFSIFLALGAYRMSKKHVLTRHLHAIEALGSATVLCVDKTGTLTLNKMAIASTYVADVGAKGASYPMEASGQEDKNEEASSVRGLIWAGILASQREPFDPMEAALHEYGQAHHLIPKDFSSWILKHEYPLSPHLLSMTHVWQNPTSSQDYLVTTKGAPEAVFTLCRLSESQKKEFSAHSERLAEEGFRVIAVASATVATATFTDAPMPVSQEEFPLSFQGLIAFSDPIRLQAASTVKICREAGIRVLMATGDHPRTAMSIAKQVGLSQEGGILTGAEIHAMDDQALAERSKTVSVFARVSPEHKLRLVNALKVAGEIVAMTGDGVNDAPALKAAHIGIAMGRRSTDVAKEASALVLLDDNISSWAEAIRLGRRIYDNIRKAMGYTISIHVPIAGLALVPVLAKLPLILLPLHIAALEMIIDPACSLIFEADPADPDLMQRPPRDPKAPLFTKRMLLISLLKGAGVFLMSLCGLLIAVRSNWLEATARTIAFTTLMLGNLGLIVIGRMGRKGLWSSLRKPNPAFWIIFAAVLCVGGIILLVPALQRLFLFAPLTLGQIVLCVAAAGVSLLWSFGVVKLFTPK